MTQKSNGSSQDGSLHDESLTQERVQQILKVGEQASSLLNSQVYNLAYQQILNTKFQEWLSSDPKEERKRESLYQQTSALVEITELLGSAVEDAHRVMQSQQAENDPAAQEQEYMNNQGFGLGFN